MRFSAAGSGRRRCSTRRARSRRSRSALLACQTLLLTLLYRLIRRLHGRQRRQPALPCQFPCPRRRRDAWRGGRQISGARLFQRRDEPADRPQSGRRKPDRRLALLAERARAGGDRPGRRGDLLSRPAVAAPETLARRRAAAGSLAAEPVAMGADTGQRRRCSCSASTGSTMRATPSAASTRRS